jgi:hypothetical protein
MRFFATVRPILTTPIRHVRLLEWSAELAALEKSVAAVAARRGGRLVLMAGQAGYIPDRPDSRAPNPIGC